MSVTPAALKASIPVEVGDTGVVAANLDTIWGQYDAKAAIDPYLQYLYALRKAYDYLISDYAKKPDRQIDGFRINYTEISGRLIAQRDAVDREIVTFETSGGSNYPIAARIAAAFPVVAGDTIIADPLDANDVGLMGSPYLGTVPTR